MHTFPLCLPTAGAAAVIVFNDNNSHNNNLFPDASHQNYK